MISTCPVINLSDPVGQIMADRMLGLYLEQCSHLLHEDNTNLLASVAVLPPEQNLVLGQRVTKAQRVLADALFGERVAVIRTKFPPKPPQSNTPSIDCG